MSYRRVTQTTARGTPGGVQVNTVGNYAAEVFDNILAGDTAGDFPNLQVGVEFQPQAINPDMHRRYIWLAACALSEADTIAWKFTGRLVFWLGSAQIMSLPIKAAGYFSATEKIGRFYVPPGQQPAIRLVYEADAQTQKDIPCLTFALRANRVSIIPDVMEVPFRGNAYAFGYQIISQYETV